MGQVDRYFIYKRDTWSQTPPCLYHTYTKPGRFENDDDGSIESCLGVRQSRSNLYKNVRTLAGGPEEGPGRRKNRGGEREEHRGNEEQGGDCRRAHSTGLECAPHGHSRLRAARSGGWWCLVRTYVSDGCVRKRYR